VDRARARDDGLNVNLPDQVQQFLDDFGGEAPSDWLYVVEVGSSDVRDALLAYVTGGPSAANVVIQAALTSIGTQLAQLYAAGARNFLIANVPDVSLTPAVAIAEQAFPGATILARMLVGIFNTQLEGVVIPGLPPVANVTLLDLYGRLNEIVDAPEDFGLTNITGSCIQPNEPPFVCQHPDEYLFWDAIHPTSAVHTLLAQLARDALGI
jgi:outer membrane lipase/esterase